MDLPNVDVTYWLIAVTFLHLIVQSINIAPSIPDHHASEKLAETNSSLAEALENCPTSCSCKLLARKIFIDCSNRQLSSIPSGISPSTSGLWLSRNRLRILTYDINLTNLSTLNVSENSINQINRRWLSSLVNLQSLDLSNNSITSQNVFQNLLLQYLDMSFNKIDKITASMFQNMKLLIDLNVSNNQINAIDQDSVDSFVSLQRLDLSFNRLVEVKHEWFRHMTKLRILLLNGNMLQSLSNVVFWPLNQLEELNLSQNDINSLGRLTFKGLISLKTLNISNNKIASLQEDTFRSLEQIQLIDLSKNPLYTFDKAFQYVSNLETLLLQHLTNLTTLTDFSFVGLSHVQVIDLSGSRDLSEIHQFAFASTKNLRTLDLSHSNLTTLKRGVFQELSNLEFIKLKGNPWTCNCHLYWMLQWLNENTNTHLWSPTDTVCQSPDTIMNHVLLDALDHDMVCTNASINKYTNNAKFRVGSTALLQCQASGSPSPTLMWSTPYKLRFKWSGAQSNSSSNMHPSDLPLRQTEIAVNNERNDKFLLMQNGDLLIRNIERGDGGFYFCTASNPLSRQSVSIRLILDYEYLTHIKIVSILVGLATSFGFLLLTLLSVLVKMILNRCGVNCRCQRSKSSPKTQQIRKILESMEHYKKQQLERLRDNYNFQVQRIKDNCMQQMERLRESYSSQAERLRDIRDYGTLQIDRIRENYYFQVQRVREYSTSQIERLRENYLFQRSRIRKFSAHHLYKLRENYKLQQQHLNKILENLNIESCRNVCQRTDSIVFEPDITLENVFVPKICLSHSLSRDNCDSIDNSSQISAYFTPDEVGSELSEPDIDSQEQPLKKGDSRTTSNLQLFDEMAFVEGATSIASDIQPHVEVYTNSELHALANETIV